MSLTIRSGILMLKKYTAYHTMLQTSMQYDPDACFTILTGCSGENVEGGGEAEQCTCSEEQAAGGL